MHPDDWWKHGIVYQIYPRSFADSNGDGVGDLAGIIDHLDHLGTLGVDALWLSPIYPSPMADFGYDVADYTDIDPAFGTLADMDALIAEAHGRGLKVLLDFVPNHSSNRHPWFLESRASRDNPKRDWYIWRDAGPDGGPPNNWLSLFGGSAWEWDEDTGQYYYHAFLKEQPDLNWRNPEVKAAMFGALRFWFERGVDGFRVDVIWHMIKDAQFRDNPPNLLYKPTDPPFAKLNPVYSSDRPEVFDVIADMRAVFDAYPGRVLIGEIYLPQERLMAYYGNPRPACHLPFNFQLMQATWRADKIAAMIEGYEASLPDGAWPNWVLGCHDYPRVASRLGAAQARIAAMMLLSLRGTPTIYYGEEIGMASVPIPPERVQDPLERRIPGFGIGRDGCRTPMRWTGGVHAGFSRAEPWLPVGPAAETVNVEAEMHDPLSMLSLYRRLVALRRAEPALHRGSWSLLSAGNNVLAYERRDGDRRFVVALNLDGETKPAVALPGAGTLALSSHLDRNHEAVAGTIELRADEGVIVEMVR